MIVDSHAHVHPKAEGLGEKQDASVASFLTELDASPLDKVVLLPIEPVIPVSFVAPVVAQRPDKLILYGSANPADGPQAVPFFEQQFEEFGVRGLKLHPRRQGFDMGQVDTVIALARVAAARDVPVLMDAFPYGKGALRDCSLELVEAISESVPEAKIIIAHMGGTRILDALILARTSYRIFLDLSLIYAVYRGSHLEQDIFYAIRRIGVDRCLYGSDYPDVGLTASYDMMRAALNERGFTAGELDQVFGGTAMTVLNLE